MKNVFYDMLNGEYIYTEYEIESSDIIKIHNSIELDVYSFKLMLNEKGFNEVEFEKHFGLLLYDSLYNTIKEICIEKDNKLERIDDEIANLREQLQDVYRKIDTTPDYTGNSNRDLYREVQRLEAEINRLTQERERVASEPTLEEIDREIAELEARREELLRNSGNNVSIEEIDTQIAELEKNIQTHRNIIQRLILNDGDPEQIRNNEARIAEYEAQIAELRRARESANPRPSNTAEIAEIDARLAELRRQREEIAQRENENPDNLLIIELEERLRQIRIEKLEIERISKERYVPGTDGNIETERLDLGEEARRIGDKIFKTAEIRRELAARQVSREEFLEFYRRGQEIATQRYAELGAALEEIKEEVVKVFVDEGSEKSLLEQEREAKEASDNNELIEVYEKMRKNFVGLGRYNEELAKIGLLDKEITSQEDVDKFVEFYTKYKDLTKEQLEKINSERKEQEENLQIFKHEIKIIEDEIKSVSMAEGNLENIESEVSSEKALRERQIRATVFGDEELKEEWSERIKRFHSHRVTRTGTYVDKDGNEHEIEYETIEDIYDKMEETKKTIKDKKCFFIATTD